MAISAGRAHLSKALTYVRRDSVGVCGREPESHCFANAVNPTHCSRAWDLNLRKQRWVTGSNDLLLDSVFAAFALTHQGGQLGRSQPQPRTPVKTQTPTINIQHIRT